MRAESPADGARAAGTRADGDAPGEHGKTGKRANVAAVSVAADPLTGRIGGRYAGTLPDRELVERLNAILAPSREARAAMNTAWSATYKSVWTIGDLAALALISEGDVKRVRYDFEASQPAKRQRLSQVILRIEAGLLVKRDGRILRLAEPERPTNPPIRRSIRFDWRGRPTLAPAVEQKVKPLFSAMMRDWK